MNTSDINAKNASCDSEDAKMAELEGEHKLGADEEGKTPDEAGKTPDEGDENQTTGS